MGSFSIWHWLIVLLVVVVIFGTKKLRNSGSDLGGAVKGFRSAMSEAEKEEADKIEDASDDASFDSTPAQESKSKKDA